MHFLKFWIIKIFLKSIKNIFAKPASNPDWASFSPIFCSFIVIKCRLSWHLLHYRIFFTCLIIVLIQLQLKVQSFFSVLSNEQRYWLNISTIMYTEPTHRLCSPTLILARFLMYTDRREKLIDSFYQQIIVVHQAKMTSWKSFSKRVARVKLSQPFHSW